MIYGLNRKYLFLSLFLHLLIFLAISYTAQEDKTLESKNEHKIEVQIEEKVKENKTKKKEEKTGNIIPKTLGKGDAKCENSYEGIGVYTTHYFGASHIEITGVIKGYPASKAGLRKGDYIRNKSGGTIRGQAGTVLVLEVYRDFKKFTMTLIREKICRD